MEANLAHDFLQIQKVAGFPLLTLICLLPTAFAVLVAFLPGEQPGVHKAMGLLGSGLTFVLSLILLGVYDWNLAGFQAVDDYA